MVPEVLTTAAPLSWYQPHVLATVAAVATASGTLLLAVPPQRVVEPVLVAPSLMV
jgi:hypothetical protein